MNLCLFSLASWLAIAPASGSGDLAEAYRRGEDVVWTIEVAGQKIGEHWLRYEGTADVLGQKAQRFTAFARLKASSVVGTVDQKFAAEMLLDERGRPLRHDLEVDVGGSYTRIELTFANGGATARVTQGNGKRDLELKVPPDVHVLANNFIAYLELLLRTNPPAPDKPTSYQLLSANALQVFPYQVTRERELSEGDVQGTVYKDSLGESLSVASDGRLLRLEVASQKLVFRRSSEKPEPIAIERPKPQQNDRITSEEVTITHDAVKLASAITRPKGSTGRLPGIFFISGSGAQDRQGYSAGIDLGTHEILDRLTEAGFCVLRVDDRGAGGSTGPLENISYDDLVSDALACVDFLLARSDVDPERVAVIGHSEGGLTAMIAADRREKIAAIVTMAAAGRSILDVLKEEKE